MMKEVKNLEGVCKQHEHTNRQKEKEIKVLKDGYRKYQ